MSDIKTHAFVIETEPEADGKWLADVTRRPGVMAYGDTENRALAAALRLLADVLDEEGA